jgi:hypothetical protein
MLVQVATAPPRRHTASLQVHQYVLSYIGLAGFADRILGNVGFQMDQGVLKSVALLSSNKIFRILIAIFHAGPLSAYLGML